MDSISFAQEVIAGDGWLIVDAQGNLKIAPLDYVPQDGDVILSIGENPLTVPEDIVTELRVSIAQQNSIQSVDAQSGIQSVLDSLEQGGDPTAEDGNDPQSGDDEGSSLTATGAVERDGAQTIAATDFQTEGVFPAGFTPQQDDAVTEFIVQTVALLSVSTVSLTDNNGEEVINGEGETAIIKGFLGSNSETLESLIITDSDNQQIVIDLSQVIFDGNGNYEVTGIDVAQLADGILTVVASGSDGDGNPVSVTDTVEKDFTYGDDGDDEGDDTTPPVVSLTDNNGEEVINGEGETATITGFIGEGGDTLDSLIITDSENNQIVIDASTVTVVDGNYEVTGIDVSELVDGELTVTAGSTDVDGNTIEVTDTVEKDFTYGDDGDDEGDDTTPPVVSLTDNNGEEVINGEGETATITGFIGEGGDTLDSLIITDSENNQIVIDASNVTVVDGNYEVTGIDVSELVDGELTVTAGSTDVDGNTIEVTDTVEKDFTYGDDGDDEGDDTTPPVVSLTDNNGEEVINGEGETATITGFIGEGGDTLDSLIITDSENNQIVIDASTVTVVDGNYEVTGIDVSELVDGELTVTAGSTDVDGNTIEVTDTVEKDFTYGDDGDDEGDDTTPPVVSLTDNNGEEVINGEGETATITGFIGEGGDTLDSLIITDSENNQIVIDASTVTVVDGNYEVTGIDVSELVDGELTVTAGSTDVDGNTIEVTDTVEKDFTYGDDGDDEGDDTTPPVVSLTDNNGEEVINGEGETATIAGFIGEGGDTLDSLTITDSENNQIVIDASTVTVVDGNYEVTGIDVSELVDGELTVTAGSTDVDGNTIEVTDTVEKDFTYGDDGDDEGDDTTPPVVSLTDNNGEEVINGEGETATITGFIGEGGDTLDSLIITDSENNQIVIDASNVTVVDGNYEVTGIDVSALVDGELTVTAGSTDVDGNTIEVTDTVEKDFTYGDDGDDEGDDTTPPVVSLTDNNGEEVINGEGETATITGFIGEGGDTLDSLIITDSENNQIAIDASNVTVVEGNYEVTGIDVSELVDGELTVTAGSTDVDGNTIEVTDTVEKDFTYGDDGDDEGDDTTPPVVSLTDNNGEEVINGEGETATITGFIGEGGDTLDSLVITDSENNQIVIDASNVTVVDGNYEVTGIDVSELVDGELAVTAGSTDVDGNTIEVTDTVEKDFTYGDDGDDEGDDTTPPVVSLTDNNGEEVINGEGETATITGFIGEGGDTLDSLIITDSENNQIVIDASNVTVIDGNYEVTGIDVSELVDGELTVTAGSTDVDGNTIEVTDTVEKDFTYGDDGDDEGDDTTPPVVSLTDNNGEEVINGEGETATITGFIGEGGDTLDSLIITDSENNQIVIDASNVTVVDGNYEVTGIDVSELVDGELTVTAGSTDVDGNTIEITDTVEKDFTYGDDGDDEGDDTTPPVVSLTDNNGEEVINGEGETATITGFIGEGGDTLDSLVITDSENNQIVIDASNVTVVDGNYEVTGIDVSALVDGELTVTAGSTDVDGNTIEVTDTVEKDFTYGEDDDDSGDIVPPEVAFTDNNGEEVITSGSETATISGFVGEGGLTLDSLIITDSENNQLVVDISGVTLVDGNYLVEGVDVNSLSEGILTVTASSTDVDGNKANVTDTVTLDINFAPEFISGSDEPGDTPNDDSYFFVSLSKGSAAGDTVGSVIAEDADGDILTYSFEEPNSYFNIDSETGKITLKEGLDDDYEGTQTFNVLVTDPDGATDTAVVTVSFIGDEDNDAAWGLTPKKLNEVPEGGFGNSINVKLLEGGNVTIRAGASLVFTFAIANMAAGLTLDDYDVLINTTDGFNSTFVERQDGTIDVIITNVTNVDKTVAKGASDDDIVSMEIYGTPDSEIEGDETFTIDLVDVNIGQPKPSQDQINVKILDGEPVVNASLAAVEEENPILAGLGEDILVGTSDSDTFTWNDGQLDDGTDVVQNFTVGEDSINLNNILDDTGSNNLDELLASIEVFVVGEDITLDIAHESGTQTIVIEDSREQFGDLISDSGNFNADDILAQIVVVPD